MDHGVSEYGVPECRKTLFLRLGAIVFFAELAHGMLLYGIIPALGEDRFPGVTVLFGFFPAAALQIVGFCLAAYVLAELAFKLPAGHQVDEKGPDLPLRIGLIVSLATVPLILFSRNPYLTIFGCFLHGMGAAPIWPAVISAWTRGRNATERGQIMGQILTAWMAGLGLGYILGNMLVGLTGKQELVATFSPVALWTVTIVAALWKGQLLGAPARQETGDEDKPAAFWSLAPELKIMALGLFMQNLAFGGLILTFQKTVVDDFDIGRANLSLLVLLGGSPAVLLMGPMGKMADRIGQRKSVIYSMLVVAPLIMSTPVLKYLPVGELGRFLLMIPGLLVAAVAYALLLPAWHALALGRIPEAQRGRSLALLMSIEMVALAGGHIWGPAAYEKIGFAAPFLVAGGVFIILATIYWMGYILPPEVHEDPHQVDLDVPFNRNGQRPGEELRQLRPEGSGSTAE